MTESANQVAANAPAKSAARIGWAVLITATLYVCYFSHLGAIGFVGPDEPRYAWVARDMAETGDWVTPRLYGKPWFEKPPLFYWGAALCFKLFGVSEAAARLPSAISALLATLALAWLALCLYGAETARWLLLLLPTTVGMIGFSHAAATDMPFSGMLTIAMVAGAVVLGLSRNENTPIIPRTPWLALILFGFFLGAAVLAKGPAAVILCGGAVFFWALFTKRWRDAFRLLHPVAIATFCLTALPWYVLCARRNPDFLRVFLIEHNFKRYLTPEFHHVQPFWFYIPVVLVACLPWTALLLWSSSRVRHLWSTGYTHKSSWLFICWAAFCVAFFSASSSKLPGYVLPSLPPLVILVAHDLSTRVQRHDASSRWSAIATGFLILSPGAALLWFELQFYYFSGHWNPQRQLFVFAALCLAGAILVLISGILNRLRLAFTGAVFILLLLVVLVKPALNSIDEESMRSAIQQAKRRWPEFSPSQTSSYKLRRSDQFSLNFYLHRDVPEWPTGIHQPTWVFGTQSLFGDSWTQEMNCIFITKSDSDPQNVVCKYPGTTTGQLSP